VTPEGLDRAAAAIAAAGRLLVSSGAGISKESGIPTFRDAQEGLWARFDPEQLATEEGFRAAPRRVWGWYAYRRRRVAACAPNAGHRSLALLERRVPELVIATQNIDGLHQAAGSTDVIELHGSIHRYRCLDRGHPARLPVPEAAGDAAELDPPACALCGSPLRPDVVWFGEMLPEAATARAWELARRCDTLLVVGTSGMVWPAAELPSVAKRAGAFVIEVNPEPSGVSRAADVVLRGPAGEVLPILVERAAAHRDAAG
jgi:NAD-dependent deacetylase